MVFFLETWQHEEREIVERGKSILFVQELLYPSGDPVKTGLRTKLMYWEGGTCQDRCKSQELNLGLKPSSLFPCEVSAPALGMKQCLRVPPSVDSSLVENTDARPRRFGQLRSAIQNKNVWQLSGRQNQMFLLCQQENSNLLCLSYHTQENHVLSLILTLLLTFIDSTALYFSICHAM